MKIVLQNNKISIPVIASLRSDEPIKIDTQFIKDPLNKVYTLFINGKKIETIKDFEFKVPKEYFIKDSIKISIEEKVVSSKQSTVYESGELPINLFLYLGKAEEELYPKVIRELLYRVNQLEKEVQKLKEEGDII